MIALPIAITTTLLSREMVQFLFAPEYAATAQCLTILVWFLPVVFLTNFFANTLGAIDEQTFVLKVTILSAVFNVVANLIFVPRFAQTGASVITVLTALLGFCFLVVKMGNKISSPISWAPLTRVLLAGIAILPFLLWKPDIHILFLLLGSIMLYVGALLLFRALSIKDIRLLLSSVKSPTKF
jgi:O-antigen/teichoic acid export membrane protein